jgi:hypothetical protein
MELRRTATVPTCLPVSAVGAGPAVVAGTVERLVFVPDGREGYLVATLADGTGTLEVRLPRGHARDWAPGAEVTAEGEMQPSGFAVRAYLTPPDRAGVRVWIEVAPPMAAAG